MRPVIHPSIGFDAGCGLLLLALSALLALLALLPAPSFAAGLSLGAALSEALRNNPNIQLARQQVAAASGQVTQAEGAFDTILAANMERRRDRRPLRQDESAGLASVGIDAAPGQVIDSTNYRIGADKALMNGVSTGIGFSVAASKDRLLQSSGIPSQLSGTLSFTVKVPLGRHAGREAVGAEVDARQTEVEVSRAELQHSNARQVLETTLAYWDWLAKTRRLEIMLASEQRLAEMIGEMKRLIDADQLPRADIELALASQAEKAAQRLSAAQALDESRRALVRLLGLSSGQPQEIGTPANDFPPYQEMAAPDPAPLVSQALTARADYDALRFREQAARYRLSGARNGLKPQIDLNLGVGYTGLAEGSPAWRAERGLDQTTGPSVGASVSLQWPWENSAALGAQRTAAAGYDSASIRLRDARDSIAANVAVALSALQRAAAQGRAGEEAVRRYAATLKNETTKRRLGSATVIDVINVEDRLNNALLNQVAWRQTYANAVVQARFELGRLVYRQQEEYGVGLDALLNGQALSE